MALCLDTATHEFGSAVDAALGEVTGKTVEEIRGKSMRVLNKWLDRKQEYRGPAPHQVTRPTEREED